MPSPPIPIILGATASGKTRLGVDLAELTGRDIVSADSRQVYRGMDIGTGKDLQEYRSVRHHLIDICDPSEEYNLYRFCADFIEAFKTTSSRIVVVGGTGLYLDAVIRKYALAKATDQSSDRNQELNKMSDQELIMLLKSQSTAHNTTDTIDRSRTLQALRIVEGLEPIQWPEYKPVVFGIDRGREETKRRITNRLKERLGEGLIEEVDHLLQQGITQERLYNMGLEYRFISQHLSGVLNYNDMYQKLNAAIHYFAKQQQKWFRNMTRKGLDIQWLPLADEQRWPDLLLSQLEHST